MTQDDPPPPAPPSPPKAEGPPPPPPPDVTANLMGDYANFVRIAHTPGDFALDFGQHVPEQSTIAMKRRIIMSPVNIKNLLRALEDNVRKYEAQYGTIPNDPTR